MTSKPLEPFNIHLSYILSIFTIMARLLILLFVQIADTTSGALVMDESAHEGTIWSLSSRPDGKGFATGGADKIVRFWDFTLAEGGSALSAVATRELQMTHDVLCVAFSRTTKAEKLMVAIGILDNTVKVFYDDSLKFFLSLYGHRLPVMALDFSSDGVLLATGSADKTVKIWGMDFGDCHRSIIAHGDSITSIRFQVSVVDMSFDLSRSMT